MQNQIMSSSFENFTEAYTKEKILQLELEKVEIVSLKLHNEYKDYQELVAFIDYLRSSESIFLMSRAGSWTGEKLKEELIKNELHMASLNAGINEKVFNMIYNDYKVLTKNVGAVYHVAEELLEKFKDHPECKEFIHYLRDITIVFIEVEKEGISFDEAKDRLFKTRMRAISADGKQEIRVLENIYEEFKKGLKTSKA